MDVDQERTFFFEITDEDKYPPAGTVRLWGRVHLADPPAGTFGVEMYDVDPAMWDHIKQSDGVEIRVDLPRSKVDDCCGSCDATAIQCRDPWADEPCCPNCTHKATP